MEPELQAKLAEVITSIQNGTSPLASTLLSEFITRTQFNLGWNIGIIISCLMCMRLCYNKMITRLKYEQEEGTYPNDRVWWIWLAPMVVLIIISLTNTQEASDYIAALNSPTYSLVNSLVR